MNGFLRVQYQYGGVLPIRVLWGGGRTTIWEKSGMQVAYVQVLHKGYLAARMRLLATSHR